MEQTKQLIEKIGIQYPIIQAPMAGGATTPALVAAVSNAGGLGSLGAGYMTAFDMREAIRKIRKLTNKVFAVNLFVPEEHDASKKQMQMACKDVEQACIELNLKIKSVLESYAPLFEEQMQVILEEKVPVFSFTFGLPDSTWIEKLKSNSTVLIGTATTLPEAYMLEENDIDIIVAQGSEAGGHRGTFLDKEEDALINLSDLIPELVKQTRTPIVAAGGIMNGSDIVKAAVLGAVGVQMGTAFLTCSESGIHQKYKDTLLAQEKDNTTLTRSFSGKLARGIRNKFIDRMNSTPDNILKYPIQNAVTKPMRSKAAEIGATDFMSMWAGQSVQGCREMGAAELVSQLMDEANIQKS